MSVSDGSFELPADMLEAAPGDVQGVLDALDTLLIDAAATDQDTDDSLSSGFIADDSLEANVFYHVFLETARRMGLTPEQFAAQLQDMRLYDLQPVEDLETFQARRFNESYHGTLGMIIRRYPDDTTRVAHIHEGKRGLTLDFDYDVPGAYRSTVADCQELTRQLGSTSLL